MESPEKTDPELGNQENFTFRPIEGTQEHINRQKYKFLTAIENSLNTNPSTLIKQKIIGFSSGDSNYAYHTITNCKLPYINSSDIKHLSITDLLKNFQADKDNNAINQNSFNHDSTYADAANTLCLNDNINNNNNSSCNKTYSSTLKTLEIKISNEITEAQKSIMAKAVNEVLSYSTNISFKVSETAFLKPEVEITYKSTLNNSNTAQKSLNQLGQLSSLESLNQPESSELFETEPGSPSSPLWQKLRVILRQRYGEAIDRSWFSKLDIEVKKPIDDNKNTRNNTYNNSQGIITGSKQATEQNNMLPSNKSNMLTDIHNNMQNHIQGSIQDNIQGRDNTQSTALATNQIIIKAPTAFMRDWIRNNYESSIEDAIKILSKDKSQEQNLLPDVIINNKGMIEGLTIVCDGAA